MEAGGFPWGTARRISCPGEVGSSLGSSGKLELLLRPGLCLLHQERQSSITITVIHISETTIMTAWY